MNINKYLISYDCTILQGIELINYNKNKTIFVVKNKKIIGSLSNGDILKSLLRKIDLNSSVYKIMNKSFKFLKTKDEEKAKKMFKQFGISLLPVLNTKMNLIHLYILKDFIK